MSLLLYRQPARTDVEDVDRSSAHHWQSLLYIRGGIAAVGLYVSWELFLSNKNIHKLEWIICSLSHTSICPNIYNLFFISLGKKSIGFLWKKSWGKVSGGKLATEKFPPKARSFFHRFIFSRSFNFRCKKLWRKIGNSNPHVPVFNLECIVNTLERNHG